MWLSNKQYLCALIIQTEYLLNPNYDMTVLKRRGERKVYRWVQEREAERKQNPQVGKEIFLYTLSFESIIPFPYVQFYPSQNSKSIANGIFFLIIHSQSIVLF